MTETLHYRGDRRRVDMTAVTGPNWADEYFKPIAVKYNRVANMSTVTFQLVPRSQWTKNMIMEVARLQHVRQMRVFKLAASGHKKSIERLHAGVDYEMNERARTQVATPKWMKF